MIAWSLTLTGALVWLAVAFGLGALTGHVLTVRE